MTRLLPLVLMAAVASGGAGPQTQVERVATRLLIDAVAVDRQGAPVMDLKPAELEVWIGHYRVPIETLTAVTPGGPGSPGSEDRPGRFTLLVLDDVALPFDAVPRAREVARHFVTRMSPGDQMAIVTLNGGSMESTSDPARLLKTIDRYNISGGGMRIDVAGQHVLKTIGALSRQLAEAPEQRKTIVAIGAGSLFDRPIPPPQVGADLRREWIDAMQAMAATNVNFYVIDPSAAVSRADAGTSGFARETGGVAFVNTNDLNGAADRIMRDAANYYLIDVADPPNGRGADLRELEVKVLRPGVTIRARRAVTGGR
jgi:VWFA-related protein